MPGASPIFHRSIAAQPFTGRGLDTRSVPVAQAAGLIRNFLSAIEAEGGASTPFMEVAQRLAERQLALWGEFAGEGGAA